MFGISFERLASRLRKKFFESLLRQDIQWFELSFISTGSVSCLLSKDGALVKNIGGAKGSSLLQGVLGILFTVIISLTTCPILGLIALLFLILVVTAAILSMIVSREIDRKVLIKQIVLGFKFILQENVTYIEMTKLSVDALINIRAVTSTCAESNFLTMIHLDLQSLYSFCLKKMHWR